MRVFLKALLVLVLSQWLLFGSALSRVQAQAPGSAPAGAEAPASELPEAYLHAAKLGTEEYELRNYAEARARFLEAHAIYPNARSLRALGAVEYDLQNYPQSIEYLQSALASDVRPLQGALRAETEELLIRARGYVATYTFQLQPPDAQLELDGERVRLREDATLIIEVGDHQLSASAPGYVAHGQTLHVTTGADDTVQIKLALMPTQAEDSERAEPLRKKWWLWTVVGVAATGLAVGLGVGLSSKEKDDEPTPSNLPGLTSVQALRFGGL